MDQQDQQDWRNKRFLTYEEAAQMLRDAGINVTVRTVQRWVKIGKLKATPVTVRVRYIPRAEIERFLSDMERLNERRTLHNAAA